MGPHLSVPPYHSMRDWPPRFPASGYGKKTFHAIDFIRVHPRNPRQKPFQPTNTGTGAATPTSP